MIDFACRQFDLKDILKCSLGLTKAEFRVFEFFIKNQDKKYTSLDISNKMHLDITTIQKSLKKLFEKNIIVRIQKNLSNGGYIYYYEIKNKNFISQIVLDTINSWQKKVEFELNSWKN